MGSTLTGMGGGRVDEREAAMAVLLADGVGPVTAAQLRTRFGSFTSVVAAAVRCPDGALRAIGDSADRREHRTQLDRSDARGARFAVAGTRDYPELLAGIHAPPVGLFVRGRELESAMPAVAIVGTRRATPRGLIHAGRLARELVSHGVAVVSGLARGIDTAAHEGALDAGGTTIAVLGSGLDRIYPPENAGLCEEIARRGVVVSEVPYGQDPRPGSFPQRNRIIAGLSMGTIVVEAGERSGALITAARALEQGREVFAVPGPVEEITTRGPHSLIKAGAKLVESIDDVLVELESSWGKFPVKKTVFARRGCSAAGMARAGAGGAAPADGVQPVLVESGETCLKGLVGLLSLTPAQPEVLAGKLGASLEEVLAALMELELRGLAKTWPGGLYTRAG